MQSAEQGPIAAGPPAVICEYANEFQEFVAFSIGKVLPMFGGDLFQDVPSTFAPVDHVAVPAEYVIGPGDEVVIRAWGQIDIDYSATVDRGGNIYVPKVGTVRVAGVHYEQLRSVIQDAISRLYRDFELSVNLGQLRSIQVFVVGQAKRPGAYTIGSLSTLVDAIFAAGGPSSVGSMRDIELRRGKETVTRLDAYDLLLRGDKSGDAKLLPGDVIFFNSIGPLAALNGSVNVPAIYELRGRQTLQDALQLAGGLTTVASSEKATVQRINERKVRNVEELSLDYDGLSQSLKNGDIVTVHSITARFDNSVTLRGNVENPGQYPWRDNMRVTDLLPDLQSLITRKYWQGQLGLEKGAAGGATPAAPGIKTEIVRTSPEINWDYAVVERLNKDQLTTELLPFNLRKAITEPDSADNLLLRPGDIVTVFSQDDLRVPVGKQSKYVYLEGEFRTAGVYRAEPGETLRHLVERVGGFTPNAYLYGSEFTRVEAQKAQQAQLATAIQNFEGEIERNAQVRLSTTTNPQDPALQQFQASLANQHRIVGQMKQIVPVGRVVLGIRPADRDVSSIPDLPLEDGDRFLVPSRPAFINVVGAVNGSGSSLLYSAHLRASDYLGLAGGTTRFADEKHMFVIRANGSMLAQHGWTPITGNSLQSARLMPGDTIVVPENLDKGAFMRGLKDWTQVLSQIGFGTAAIKILRQ
jgi:polysaccharide export outer membrane protein